MIRPRVAVLHAFPPQNYKPGLRHGPTPGKADVAVSLRLPWKIASFNCTLAIPSPPQAPMGVVLSFTVTRSASSGHEKWPEVRNAFCSIGDQEA
jgi:hypothetical protein